MTTTAQKSMLEKMINNRGLNTERDANNNIRINDRATWFTSGDLRGTWKADTGETGKGIDSLADHFTDGSNK